MKIYLLEAQHQEVPGIIVRAFASDELRKHALGLLQKEFNSLLEHVEEFDVELEENFRP